MIRKAPSGKLIISRSNNYYETFHNLNLIIVKYNKNTINISHNIQTLIIEGNNNDEDIGLSGFIKKLIINGDNNTINAKDGHSIYNIRDNGEGNKIYEINDQSNEDSAEEDIDEESQEKEENENDYEEENSENDNRNRYRRFQAERNGVFSLNNENKYNEEDDEEDDDEEDAETNLFDIYGGDGNIDYYTLLEINDQIQMQLRREREKEQFRSALVNMVFNGKYNKNSDDEEEDVLSDLIDICFKNVSKGVKEGNEKCVICYENFKENENVKMTGCFHIFHFKCIKKWAESKEDLDEYPDCPICRRKL